MTLKAKVRAWLGIDSIPSIEMLKALELTEQRRHNALMEMLNRIEKMLQNRPASPALPFTSPQFDWDTIQAIASQQLENDMKNAKEN